jgi:chorismate dehydratase
VSAAGIVGGAHAAPRVGRIEFVNCFPLYLHFAEELAARGHRAAIVDGDPAQLNRMLIAGEIDVALPSSIEFARHADELVLLPRVSISSFGAVDSIQLFSTVPREELRTVAVSEKSATSVVLLKVLCREWGIAPEYAARVGPLADALASFDGLLLIGDEAMHVLRNEVYPYHYDLGEEWRAVTGMPMVYAVCAARRTFAAQRAAETEAIEASLIASRDRCAANAHDTAAAAALVYDFNERFLYRYFDQLKFGFTDEYRRGLLEFYRRAQAIGELAVVPDLELAEPAAGMKP